MRFPNALKGVSKLFIAEILQLIGVVVGIVAIVVMLGAYTADPQGLVEGIAVAGGISAIVALVSGVIVIIAFILNLVGLVQAQKDDNGFRNALICTLVALAVSIVGSCFQTINPALAGWMEFVATILELVIFEYVVVGIMSLAGQIGDQKMVEYGNRMRTIISVLFFIILIIQFVGIINPVFAGTLSIVEAILELILYIAYIIYLAKAKKMLANS